MACRRRRPTNSRPTGSGRASKICLRFLVGEVRSLPVILDILAGASLGLPSAKSLSEGKYLIRTEGTLTEEGAARSRFTNKGDLLLTNSGATLGVPKINSIRGCMNDGVAVLRLFHSAPLNDFAYLYLRSQTDAFRKVNQGMGQPNLNTPIIAGWFFPLPPLKEQGRIVAKVDELMSVCDELEAQLTTSQTESRRLLEAVLHEALSSPRCP